MVADCETVCADELELIGPSAGIKDFEFGADDATYDRLRIIFGDDDYSIPVIADRSEFEDRQHGKLKAVLREKLRYSEQYKKRRV